MRGGFGISDFQAVAKDMQMEKEKKCSSKPIRTHPDPHPCLKWMKKLSNIPAHLGPTGAKSPRECSRWKNRHRRRIPINLT